MPQLEELDTLSTQGMMKQAGTGESQGASCCFLLWLPPRSHARLFHSVFLFHLKNHLLLAPAAWAEWLFHDAIAPFYFIFDSNLIPASLCPGLCGWFCFLIEDTLSLSAVQHSAIRSLPCQLNKPSTFWIHAQSRRCPLPPTAGIC